MSDLLSSSTTLSELAPLLICVGVALVLGLLLAGTYCVRNRHTASFVITLALLPAIVCVVIALVNGNVGAGVAVAGAFSLIRFRSVPGSARDIGFVFLAMAVGIACGMGEPLIAVMTALLVCAVYLVYQLLGLGAHSSSPERTLHVVVPEDLDFTTIFDDVLDRYTTSYELVSVKTSNLGSLYKLTYAVELRRGVSEKELMDELRVRNGNLEVALGHKEEATYVL